MATQDAIVKELSARVSPFQIAILRFSIHSVLLIAFIRLTGRPGAFRTRRPGLQVVRALTLLGSGLCMHLSIMHIPLAQATVIQFLSPLLVTLFSVMFLDERIGWRRTTALVLGFAGTIAVVGPNVGAGMSPAWALPLMSAASVATYLLLTRRLSDPSENLPSFVLMPLICIAALVPVQPFVWVPLSPSDAAVILLLGLIGTAAHVGLQLGLRIAPASVLSPFLYSQVLFAGILGVIFFSDPLGPGLLLGSALIVGSGLAIWWIERPRAPRAPAAAPQTCQ